MTYNRLLIALFVVLTCTWSNLSVAAERIPRIGMLVAGPPPAEHSCVAAFKEALGVLGYVEGRTIDIDMRWSAARAEETFPKFAAEFVRQKVNMVVSVSSQGMIEAKAALAGMPVVLAVSSYPVERGLVASLARPGGNITGLATFSSELYSKRVQLLTEVLPGVRKIAVIRVAGDMGDYILRDLEAAAHLLKLQMQVIDVSAATDLPGAFETAVKGQAQAVMTSQSPFFYQHREAIAALALKNRLPSFSGEPGAAEAGFLLTHGPGIPESCRRAASYVDRIIKGAKPAELPVEQPIRFDMVINLKTARTLGIKVPYAAIVRADRVIE